jgi:hypothetical protein
MGGWVGGWVDRWMGGWVWGWTDPAAALLEACCLFICGIASSLSNRGGRADGRCRKAAESPSAGAAGAQPPLCRKWFQLSNPPARIQPVPLDPPCAHPCWLLLCSFQVREFVRHTDATYSLGCSFLTHPDFNAGLKGYLDGTGVLAIVLGTRRCLVCVYVCAYVCVCVCVCVHIHACDHVHVRLFLAQICARKARSPPLRPH